ncbi:MAG TPA: hypothetical protein VI454_12395 [Verrucomicrobiae bacterium]|jgi:hypothetical protein
MSLGASRNQLMTVTKVLAGQWQQTRNHWLDAKSQEFDTRYMEALEANVTAALTAIERLDKILAKVRSDCE